MDKRRENFDKREALLEAALSEFSQKSFKDASLNTILSNAGVSKGSFYYAFKDKEDLYLYMIQDIVELKRKYFMQKGGLTNITPPKDAGFFQFLRSLVSYGVDFCYEYPKLYRFATQYARESDEFKQRIMWDEHIDFERNMQPLLEAAFSSGDIDDTYGRELAEKILFYFISHFYEIIGLEETDTQEDLRRKTEMLFYFLEHGLGRKETN